MSEDLDKQDNGPLVPLERWMARTFSPLVPAAVSANQVTLFGGLCGVLAGLSFYLASFGRAWFVVGAVFVLLHWIADNVDGHIARTRNQASAAGRFLDIFLDAVTFGALGLGLACASYAHFEIVAVATMLCLLQYVLTVLWIALTRVWPFPVFGPAEASLTMCILALLMLVLPVPLFTLRGMPFSLIDAAFALTIPSTALAIVTSAVQLYRHLQAGQGRAAGA